MAAHVARRLDRPNETLLVLCPSFVPPQLASVCLCFPLSLGFPRLPSASLLSGWCKGVALQCFLFRLSPLPPLASVYLCCPLSLGSPPHPSSPVVCPTSPFGARAPRSNALSFAALSQESSIAFPFGRELHCFPCCRTPSLSLPLPLGRRASAFSLSHDSVAFPLAFPLARQLHRFPFRFPFAGECLRRRPARRRRCG